jgi:hypothetical protein
VRPAAIEEVRRADYRTALIDQLVPSPRVLRKNDSAVTGMVAAIKEYRMPIRVVVRLSQAGRALCLPPARPNQTTLLILGSPRQVNGSKFRRAFGTPAMEF